MPPRLPAVVHARVSGEQVVAIFPAPGTSIVLTLDGLDEDGESAASGVYFVRVRTEDTILNGQVIRTSPR